MKKLIFIVFLMLSLPSIGQSVASIDYGGSYYSNDQGQFFSSDIVQTSKLNFENKVVLKVGFLNNRLLSLITKGQNNGTSTEIPVIVFPNPATTNINFFVSNIHEVKEVHIYTTLGKLVSKSGSEKSINIAHLAKGFYLLKIYFMDSRTTSAKFLKQ